MPGDDTPKGAVVLPAKDLARLTGRPVITPIDRLDYETALVELGKRAADEMHDQNTRRTDP